MKMSKGRRTGITMNKKVGSTLIAMTIIIFMLFLTLGMFTGKFGGSAKAEVANAQASIVEGTLNNDNVDEGTSGTYTFSVTNTNKQDGDKVSEVALKYALHIETDESYTGNVEYKLYRVEGNKETEIQNKVQDEENKEWYTADDMTFDVKSNAQVHQYKLEFKPDRAGEFNFKVKVKAEQKD